MFQFIRRFSGSFLPRPDRPWRDDATSHAPTIGRKRRHSVTEHDHDGSTSTLKRSKTDIVKPDTECDSASGGESPAGDATSTSPVEGQDVKEVTKGVKKVDLEAMLNAQVALSPRPEGIPLPDSPSGSPEPESESQEPGSPQSEEVEDEVHADDMDSLASSQPRDVTEEIAEVEPVTDASQDNITLTIGGESDRHDAHDTLEDKKTIL